MRQDLEAGVGVEVVQNFSREGEFRQSMAGCLGISTFVFDEQNRSVALSASHCCTHTLAVSATP